MREGDRRVFLNAMAQIKQGMILGVDKNTYVEPTIGTPSLDRTHLTRDSASRLPARSALGARTRFVVDVCVRCEAAVLLVLSITNGFCEAWDAREKSTHEANLAHVEKTPV